MSARVPLRAEGSFRTKDVFASKNAPRLKEMDAVNPVEPSAAIKALKVARAQQRVGQPAPTPGQYSNQITALCITVLCFEN